MSTQNHRHLFPRATKLPIVVQVAMPEEAAPLVDADWRVYQLRQAEKELGLSFPRSVLERGNAQVYTDFIDEGTATDIATNSELSSSNCSSAINRLGPHWPNPIAIPAGVACYPINCNSSQALSKTSTPSNSDIAPAVVTVSGVGLVNATYTATVMAQRYGTEALLSGGTAGGLATDRGVGQIVAGENYFLHQADATIFDYKIGQVPGMPPSYQAHQLWLDLARSVATELDWPDFQVGDIVSGDAFITSRNIDQICNNYPAARAADMESAALAQTAWRVGDQQSNHHFPFLSLRCISDLCSPDGAQVFHINVNLAAAISAAFLVEMIIRADQLQ